MLIRFLYTCFLILLSYYSNAATNYTVSYLYERESIDTIPEPVDWFEEINPRYFRSGDTIWDIRGICQPLYSSYYLLSDYLRTVPGTEPLKKAPLFKVNGNVQYDYLYQSLVDTPFAQKDYSQHTIQTNLKLVYKNELPVNIRITQRFSNSPLFRNIFDVNALFTDRLLLDQQKQKLIDALEAKKRKQLEKLFSDEFSPVQQMINIKQRLETVTQWIQAPERTVELVALREKILQNAIQAEIQKRKLEGKEIFDIEQIKRELLNKEPDFFEKRLKDTARYEELSKYKRQKQVLKDLQDKYKTAQADLDKYEKKVRDNIYDAQQKIRNIKNLEELKDYHLLYEPEEKLPKYWSVLSSVKSVGIGRSWVDYSALTVRNIALTGAHIELNPGKLYVAAGIGNVNTQFRDFVVNRSSIPRQPLQFFRIGAGQRDHRSFIFTYYDGKKSLLNIEPNTTTLHRVRGISLEHQFRLDENNIVIVEVAKSSGGTAAGRADGDKLFDFSDRKNEAYSVELESNWPKIDFQFTGFYRRMGATFQSFNLFTSQVTNEAYQLRLKKNFWNRQLNIEAGLRKNDFSGSLYSQDLYSKTVFKTLLATLRLKKLPVLTVGFFPASQLTALDDRSVMEQHFNTLTGVLSHGYSAGRVQMNTQVSYLRFYNNQSDTNFIYHNATSWSLHHYIFFNRLQFQSDFSYAQQSMMDIWSLGQQMTYQLTNWLEITTGIKSSKVPSVERYWGGLGGLRFTARKLGMIQFRYERNHLPANTGKLVPVDIGRVTYAKTI